MKMPKLQLWIAIAAFSCFLPNLALADSTITFGTSQNDWQPVGQSTTWQKQAVKFTATEADTSATASFSIRTGGTPTDDLKVSIQADSAGVPSGTDLGSAQIAAASVPSSCGAPSSFPAISGLSLSAGQSYWGVFSRSGSPSNTNFFQLCFADNSDPPYTYVYNGSAWVTMPTIDASFHGYLYGTLALSLSPTPPFPVSFSNPMNYASTTCQAQNATSASPIWACTSSSTPVIIDLTQLDFIAAWGIGLSSFALFVWMLRKHT